MKCKLDMEFWIFVKYVDIVYIIKIKRWVLYNVSYGRVCLNINIGLEKCFEKFF